jgi:hypothetical protein
MLLYKFLHNLLNIPVHIAKTMGLQKADGVISNGTAAGEPEPRYTIA